MTSILGNIAQKLMIMPFSDPDYLKPASAPFRASINPESYTYKYKTEYCETQGPGASGAALKFSKMLPQEFTFDFIFDGTGIVKNLEDNVSLIPADVNRIAGVTIQLEKFKHTVYEFNGDKHRPWYLMLLWGTLIFKGVLTSMDIEYKLFGPDGTPLRAIAKCSFKGSIEDLFRLAKNNLMSPDITHERKFKSSDTLPLLANDIYNDQAYYIDVAKANRLDGFRNIKTGTPLYFIPLEK